MKIQSNFIRKYKYINLLSISLFLKISKNGQFNFLPSGTKNIFYQQKTFIYRTYNLFSFSFFQQVYSWITSKLIGSFFTLLGFCYVRRSHNLTIKSNLSTDELPDIMDLDRCIYLFQAGAEFQCLLSDFLANVNINLNSYNYSELMSLYQSLNQVYI